MLWGALHILSLSLSTHNHYPTNQHTQQVSYLTNGFNAHSVDGDDEHKNRLVQTLHLLMRRTAYRIKKMNTLQQGNYDENIEKQVDIIIQYYYQ